MRRPHLRGSRRNNAMTFGETIMAWLPDNEKHFEGKFIRFDTIHERDRHTDRHTVTDTA